MPGSGNGRDWWNVHRFLDMTHQQALDLMMHDSFQTQAEADGKLLRAKLSSTQLPTYFLDDRQWWTLRKKYEAAKGSAFTLEEFHDRALDQGPLPLEYLEKIILPHKQTEPFRRWVS